MGDRPCLGGSGIQGVATSHPSKLCSFPTVRQAPDHFPRQALHSPKCTAKFGLPTLGEEAGGFLQGTLVAFFSIPLP